MSVITLENAAFDITNLDLVTKGTGFLMHTSNDTWIWGNLEDNPGVAVNALMGKHVGTHDHINAFSFKEAMPIWGTKNIKDDTINVNVNEVQIEAHQKFDTLITCHPFVIWIDFPYDYEHLCPLDCEVRDFVCTYHYIFDHPDALIEDIDLHLLWNYSEHTFAMFWFFNARECELFLEELGQSLIYILWDMFDYLIIENEPNYSFETLIDVEEYTL